MLNLMYGKISDSLDIVSLSYWFNLFDACLACENDKCSYKYQNFVKFMHHAS